jgi:hypothetical protein
MTIQEANKLLDMSKDGVSIPDGVLDEALFMSWRARTARTGTCPTI